MNVGRTSNFGKPGKVYQAPKWAAEGTRQDTRDSFSNGAARLGAFTDNLVNSSSYPLQRLSWDYVTLVSLYRSNWIARAVVEAIPADELRQWVSIKGEIEPKLISKFERKINKTRTVDKLQQALTFSRLFGGAVCLIIIKGQEDQLAEPLDLDEILPGAYCGLQVFDRWSGIVPDTSNLIQDLAEPDYGLPEYFIVSPQTATNGNGTADFRVHHSRILRFTGRMLPKWEQIAESYWGLSEIEIIWDALRMADNSQWNIASLMFMANILVMKTSDNVAMNLGMGTQQQQTRLYNTLNAMRGSINNQGMLLLDKEGSLESHQMNFAGLSDVWEKMMLTVCGAAQIPMSRLYGMTQGGLSQTNEGDERQYYDMIGQKQNRELRPQLEKLFQVVQMSEFGEVQDDFEFGFVPLHLPSDQERAELAKQNTDAIVVAYNAGLVDQQTCLMEMAQQSDASGLWSNVSEEKIAAAKDTVDPMLGDLSIGPMKSSAEREQAETKDARPDYNVPPQQKRITFAGLPLVIEWPAGAKRELRDKEGNVVYSRVLENAYGEIEGTVGRDGDPIDVIVGTDETAPNVFIFDFKDLGPNMAERSDEDKTCVGFGSLKAAEKAFIQMYGRDWIAGCIQMPVEDYREWLAESIAVAA